MRTGTAKELGFPAQLLSHMGRRGEARIVAVIRNQRTNWSRCNVWEIDERCNVWHIDEPAGPRTLGAGLRILRHRARLSQQQVCDICDFEQGHLAAIELDKLQPRVHSLARLLGFYGVRFAEFFAYIDALEAPGRLPREADYSIPDALLTVRVKLGMEKSAAVSQPRTIRKQCARHNVDWLAFWQLFDAHIEPRRL